MTTSEILLWFSKVFLAFFLALSSSINNFFQQNRNTHVLLTGPTSQPNFLASIHICRFLISIAMGLCQAHEACLEAPLLKVITKIGKGQLRLFNVIINITCCVVYIWV